MAKIMDDGFIEYIADAVMDIQSQESSVLPALRKQLSEAERGINTTVIVILPALPGTGAALAYHHSFAGAAEQLGCQ